MAYVQTGQGALEYFPCHYGRSRVLFRGPRRDLSGEYAVVLGGSESYGRFVTAPWPALLEERLDLPVANLACVNAGPDVWLGDPALAEVLRGARLAVLQIGGAVNLSNRFYTVHPRRNDRFLAATPALRALYRDVDFTEIHFTRHLIRALWSRGPERFAPVAEELRRVWQGRMSALLNLLPERRVLFWTADHAIPAEALDPTLDPALIDRGLLSALLPKMAACVEHVSSPAARAEGVRAMRFSAGEEDAARGQPGAAVHQEAAEALLPVLEDLL